MITQRQPCLLGALPLEDLNVPLDSRNQSLAAAGPAVAAGTLFPRRVLWDLIRN